MLRDWTWTDVQGDYVAVTRLTVPQLQVLKLAALLVDPDLLTDQQQRSLESSVVTLIDLLAGSAATDEAERRFVVLHDSTHAMVDDIDGDSTMATLAGLWIAEVKSEDLLRVQTLDRYRSVLQADILPVLGQVRVGGITVGMLDRFLKHLHKVKSSQARTAKVILNQMLGLAVRHGALPTNPVRDVGRLRKPRRDIRVLTLAEVDRLRAGLRERRPRLGPSPNQNLADVVDLMLGTGARIGEILALRWRDIDLRDGLGTVTVCGTLIFLKGDGWSRQEMTKSEAGHRTIYLPTFAIEMLRRRRPSLPDNDLDAVFASRNGTWLQPSNVRRDFRKVRSALALEWVTPHIFRKTVATLLHEQGYDKAATAQLGHSTEDVTKTYYVAKPKTAPDVSAVLQRLGPQTDGW